MWLDGGTLTLLVICVSKIRCCGKRHSVENNNNPNSMCIGVMISFLLVAFLSFVIDWWTQIFTLPKTQKTATSECRRSNTTAQTRQAPNT